MMRARRYLLPALAAGTLLAATAVRCSPPGFLNDESMALLPCPGQTAVAPREHAFNAVMFALQDCGWVAESIDPAKNFVVSRACKTLPNGFGPTDYLKRTDDECVSLTFSIDSTAQVLVFRQDRTPLSYEMLGTAYRWLGALERSYSICRCYSDEVLARGTPTPTRVRDR